VNTASAIVRIAEVPYRVRLCARLNHRGKRAILVRELFGSTQQWGNLLFDSRYRRDALVMSAAAFVLTCWQHRIRNPDDPTCCNLPEWNSSNRVTVGPNSYTVKLVDYPIANVGGRIDGDRLLVANGDRDKRGLIMRAIRSVDHAWTRWQSSILQRELAPDAGMDRESLSLRESQLYDPDWRAAMGKLFGDDWQRREAA
jgi:hypothetical protein